MVTLQGQPISQVVMPQTERDILIDHCVRKFEERYEDDEPAEPKAYGLIGGSFSGETLTIGKIAPLRRNARAIEPHKGFMDDALNRHAIASVTPLDKRGWVADPAETRSILMDFARADLELVGTYHMHRVSWKGDSLRDTPTKLDTILAEQTDLLMFIISMVEPTSPIVRTFYEGDGDKEVVIAA